MELRNRLVMAPMENLFASPDGLPSDRTVAYFEARAKGGVGLVTVGASTIDARHPEVLNSLRFHDDSVIDAHRALCDAIHAHGARVQPQLVHPGPDGLGPELNGIDALGPSAIQAYLTKTTSRAMSADDFAEVVDLYRAAAVRVRRAGYDGIELHAAHGYMLLGSFLTPWRNARRDEYGARRPEGRIRAIAEVVRAIKHEVGADFPLTLRISGYERVAGGRESSDTARLAPSLVEAGVDAFHVSGGVIDRFVSQMVNGSDFPPALNEAAAAAVKRAVDVPVIVVGRIHDPALAERILEEGSADLVAMARPLLADPELPRKARDGRVRELRLCISCQNCIDAMEMRGAMDCAVNPRTGRENELSMDRAGQPKHVIVVGGGPGGLEAARVAGLRGHRVSLFEREAHLGGAFRMASVVHPENQPFLDWLIAQVEASGADITKGTAIAPEEIVARGPDAVVVATGGRVVAPSIPGAELPHVLTGPMLRELLAGRVTDDAGKLPVWQRLAARLLGGPAQQLLAPATLRSASEWMPLGRRVVVVGADLAALELAELLASRGRRVSVLESGDRVAPEVGGKRRTEHEDRLDRLGVALSIGVAIDRISTDGVVLRQALGGEHLVRADTVVLAGEVAPATDLHDALVGRVPELFAVGDCTGLGLVQKAVLEGARAGCSL
jgi:2,4-dienoyl-CoA reductase (NADPH2)